MTLIKWPSNLKFPEQVQNKLLVSVFIFFHGKKKVKWLSHSGTWKGFTARVNNIADKKIDKLQLHGLQNKEKMYLHNEPPDHHSFSLSNAMNTHDSLLLYSWIPPWILWKNLNINVSCITSQLQNQKHSEDGRGTTGGKFMWCRLNQINKQPKEKR
jgi:hypothetical protein